ncbi:hypothetical protein CDD83_9283 [Cordyceps sp. RAO-2017]|nr:hypothetical protein CDD83_9283 [Cordyceps sp. RAO-2017]
MEVFKWILDTRPLWPEAKETKQLAVVAKRALALLSAEEQTQVLKYYFVKDAKLAIGSALLKRLAISRYGGVGWAEAQWTRDARTKPVFLRPDGSEPVLFNVTHQAGVVALVALVGRPPSSAASVAIGVDIVCASERRARDHASIAADGWPRYVAVHEDVFSPGETARLNGLSFDDDDGRDERGGEAGRDRRLAYFYTLWCLREAYIKMTGDALLAPWLRELDFRYFAPPGERPPERRAMEVWFRDRRVDDVHMRLERLLDDDYVLCTAVRCGSADRPHLEAQVARPVAALVLDEVLDEAEAA